MFRSYLKLLRLSLVLVTGLFPAWQVKAEKSAVTTHSTPSVLAAPDPDFSAGDTTSIQEVGFNPNRPFVSLPAQFFANYDNSTKGLQESAARSNSSAQTTQQVTSLFVINPPLVNVKPPFNTLNPNNGTPVAVAPEPEAFLSALLCLFILGLLKVLTGRKRRGAEAVKLN